ncbi:hypothetical protein [Vibrio owensii]|uniref:hypothetical protein n=1 Tax=Vibrio owensii TaxID=696485 RepID=UPI0018F18778|nr:hypothetical protein [Vibrio owensii]
MKTVVTRIINVVSAIAMLSALLWLVLAFNTPFNRGDRILGCFILFIVSFALPIALHYMAGNGFKLFHRSKENQEHG